MAFDYETGINRLFQVVGIILGISVALVGIGEAFGYPQDYTALILVPVGGLAYFVTVWVGKALVWIIKGFTGRG